MALSEDTIAVVAAQLATAHCTTAPLFRNNRSHREMAGFVAALFDSYKLYLETGNVDHFNDSRPNRRAQDQETEQQGEFAEDQS